MSKEIENKETAVGISAMQIEAIKAELKAEIRKEVMQEVTAEMKSKMALDAKATESKESEIQEKNKKLYDEEAKKVGKLLKDEKTVRIKIPKDQLNPKQDSVPVMINGYRYRIKRGETVDVPQSVASLLEKGGYI